MLTILFFDFIRRKKAKKWSESCITPCKTFNCVCDTKLSKNNRKKRISDNLVLSLA